MNHPPIKYNLLKARYNDLLSKCLEQKKEINGLLEDKTHYIEVLQTLQLENHNLNVEIIKLNRQKDEIVEQVSAPNK